MTFSRKTALAALLLSVLAPSFAGAQDPTPTNVKPNVLLLVDSSGSMEYKTGEATGDPANYPTCTPGAPASTNERSRWIEVVEVLSGTIRDYSCEQIDRSTTTFSSEFQLVDGTPPPDVNFRNPYHRPLSYGCALTPDRSTNPTNAFTFVEPDQAAYPVAPASPSACLTSFDQDGDGFIDAYDRLVRFGLMTFDTDADVERGYNPTDYSSLFSQGVEGTWSYYPVSPAEGKPADCSTLQPMEVGVRNGAAPTFEGKMIHFGDQDADDTEDSQRHHRIQQVLLATRPYGATPINGALNDARSYFWEDEANDPLDPLNLKFSPKYDDFVECACREQHIIFITDGEPNLDLRPECEAGGTFGDPGVCPFPDDPAAILEDLYTQPTSLSSCTTPSVGANKYRIQTHVVGYSTTTYDIGSGPQSCEDLKTNVPDWNTASGTCETTTNEDLKICCTLHELAAAGSGGTSEPHLAPDSAALQSALGSIIKSIVNTSASATRPVRSPGVGRADDSMAAFRLLTSYETDTGTSGLWRGNIERVRWTCGSSGVPELQPKDPSAGDDFAINTANGISDREFVTYIPTLATPEQSLRPHLSGIDDEGLGDENGGAQETRRGAAFASAIPAATLGIDGGEAICTGAASAAACRDRVMNWTLGFSDGATVPNHRCVSSGDYDNCSVIGDVMHSSPVIVDRPNSNIDDASYDQFSDSQAGRTMMAYVSSNDGMLHGFRASPNDLTESAIVNSTAINENFAFIPPAILGQLGTQYPDVRLKLLDGTAVVQDVVASGTSFPYRLERTEATSKTQDNTWRTILVQSFGGAQSGYFAIDITDAQKPSGSGLNPGPQFLWQITSTGTSDSLFGKGGTPLITTVNVGGVETAVAILPGGEGGSAASTCIRTDSGIDGGNFGNTHHDTTVGTFPPRGRAQCYTDNKARSLTVVRLDTGRIIRTFRNSAAELTGISDTSIYGLNPTRLDAPITGAPAAYPHGTGLVSDRIFVGDQDGTLWRVDVSDPNPRNWEMKLFFDLFSGHAADEGKPITLAPVLSVDEEGQITINVATGAQDLSGGTGDDHYVFSLTEKEDGGTRFLAQVNWREHLTNGEHVLGEMSLLGGKLYFSTVDPENSNACNPSPANIWGLDYIEAEGGLVLAGGAPGLSPDPDPRGLAPYPFLPANDLIGDNGGSGQSGAVFGVSVEFQPTCADVSTGDSSFGGGSRSKVSNISESKLQLVFQTATANTNTSGLGFTTGFQAVGLASPPTASTIRSWATVLDY